MNITGVKLLSCECGRRLLLGRPESREAFEGALANARSEGISPQPNLIRMDGIEFSFVILDCDSIPCPGCGRLINLPPAEALDIERSEKGREVMNWIDKFGITDDDGVSLAYPVE